MAWSKADERLYQDVEASCAALQGLLSPVTERFAPVDDDLDRLWRGKLSRAEAQVKVGIIGPRGSGKSSLVNTLVAQEVLPQHTSAELTIIPGTEAEAQLRTPTGKCIAFGREGVRKYLAEEERFHVPELASRRLHVRFSNDTASLPKPWQLVDHPPAVHGILPKSSSVAFRTFACNRFAADVLFYCIDARALGAAGDIAVFSSLVTLSDEELHSDHGVAHEGRASSSAHVPVVGSGTAPVTPLNTRRRLLASSIFFLTFADFVTAAEDAVVNVHDTASPTLRSVDAVRQRFGELCMRVFGQRVPEERVILVSNRNALLTKAVLNVTSTADLDRGDHAPTQELTPSIEQMYDYAEAVHGSAFMQRIDSLREGDLRSAVIMNAWHTTVDRSGVLALDQTLRVLDANSVRYMLQGVATGAAEIVDTLLLAQEHGLAALATERASAGDHHDVLDVELRWTQGAIAAVEAAAASVPERLEAAANAALEEFRSRRLEELRLVLEHRGLEHFMSRHLATIVELNTALKKFEAFSASHAKQRRYLAEKALAEKAMSERTLGAAPDSEGFSFLASNNGAIAQAMEHDKRQQLEDLFLRFAHHLRDEFSLLFDELQVALELTARDVTAAFIDAAREASLQATKRSGVGFNLESVTGTLANTAVVQPHSWRLNNFLRELPEHVAHAAAEIDADNFRREVEEWQTPPPGSPGMQTPVSKSDAGTARTEATTETAPSRFGGGSDLHLHGAAPVSPTEEWRRHGQDLVPDPHGALLAQARVWREQQRPLPTPGEASMTQHLEYVHLAWTLALSTVTLDQVADYNLPVIQAAAETACDAVVGHLRRYEEALLDGLQEQTAKVRTLEAEEQELHAVAAALPPLAAKLQEVQLELANLNEAAAEDARH